MSDSPRKRLRENATEITSVLVTGVWLAALFTHQSWWLPALLVGYVAVVPIVAILFGDEEDRNEWWDKNGEKWWNGRKNTGENRTSRSNESVEASEPNTRDALETLRDRYARGELTDEQFERKVELLVKTETMEDVEDGFREGEHERIRERE
ncbi:SHOCT domain-containing protein [Haladaptatus sp. NG-SE-30]